MSLSKSLLNKWNTLCQLHVLTKKYTLLAEEYNLNMKALLQPMKEQKDAYEHLIRVYTAICTDTQDDDYKLKNMDKAIGHEYRAFFDTMDYLSIIIYELISEELKNYSFEQIIAVYPDYTQVKKNLVSLPAEIATIREQKDIGKKESVLTLTLEYADIIDNLLEDYKTIAVKVVPKLAQNKEN